MVNFYVELSGHLRVSIRRDEVLHQSGLLFQAKGFQNSTIGMVYSSRCEGKWNSGKKYLCISSAPHLSHRRLSPAYKYLKTREIQKSLMFKVLLEFLISLSRIRKNADAIFLFNFMFT